MKLNDEHFSSGIVIIYFWDFVWFCFVFIAYTQLNFAMKVKDANCKSQWNFSLFCEQGKTMSELNISHGKMSDFISFPLFEFTLFVKLRNFNFKSHWDILMFFDKKKYGVRF